MRQSLLLLALILIGVPMSAIVSDQPHGIATDSSRILTFAQVPTPPPPLDFTPRDRVPSQGPASEPGNLNILGSSPIDLQDPFEPALFTGGGDSLVARAVGHAEGTRTVEGEKTDAYYGHRDPGNQQWNLGSFSFQHCPDAEYQCDTPEDADIHQLRRLQKQTQALTDSARSLNIQLSLEEILNGIDLANQAPLAALGNPGYVTLLQAAKTQAGLQGTDAILWARTRSYWHPQRHQWDAPGFGNHERRIRRDQQRRMQAIAHLLHPPSD